MADILVVDDNLVFSSMLVKLLEGKGFHAQAVGTLVEGLRLAEERGWDVVLLDVGLPDGNGLEFIDRFMATPAEPEIIIVTGHAAPDWAEQAIARGVWSYIEKQHIVTELEPQLTKLLRYRSEKRRVCRAPLVLKRKHIIGHSPSLIFCLGQLAQAAANEVSVLITGESGTGKELFARALHENSNRAQQDFVVVDCAALPDSLIESILFGHVRGAFTGADRSQPGLIAQAHGGTLFLDEVGELPLAMQKAFLRVLQEHRFRPLGDTREHDSNFRLVAATNRHLPAMVEAGSFRGDLFFRLQSICIDLPPLRQRPEDIKELAGFFVTRLCERYGQGTKGISADFMEALQAYDWPGNVRELSQVIEQAFANSQLYPTIFSMHLPREFRIRQARSSLCGTAQLADAAHDTDHLQAWRDYKQWHEQSYLTKLMQLVDHNVPQACALSGLSRARLYQLLRKYSLLTEAPSP
ncbi:MAG: Fis family transcriptional regulator [Desulfobulbaceae bacterium A2]|nr:MAG: Fis family transcriptional regulator [Desulfobulbaceae bacterium A2]